MQTFGDLVNFNPHPQALIADGLFDPSGRFRALPPVPEALRAERPRCEVPGLLVRKEEIPAPLAGQTLAWRHSGFTVHNLVRVAADDAEGRKSLAACMLCAAFSLEETTDDPEGGTILYRSKLHAALKRDFQAMPGVEWLALLCKHVPDRHAHLVRDDGRCPSRPRGAEREHAEIEARDVESTGQARQAAKAAWAKLIRKVYEIDPLLCP